MITPTISAICREVFETLPSNLKEAALSLGATRWEMLNMAIIKNSLVGIVAAATLGLGRALGETMAVTMVIGNRAEIKSSLFAPAQTMASVIANEYAEAGSDLHLAALSAVGIALFFVSLVINSLARLLIWRLQRKAKI
jgi:phosphate transport system permease protein